MVSVGKFGFIECETIQLVLIMLGKAWKLFSAWAASELWNERKKRESKMVGVHFSVIYGWETIRVRAIPVMAIMKIRIHASVIIAISPSHLFAQSCCVRFIKTSQIIVPPGESGTIAKNTFESVYHKRKYGGGPLLHDCPLKVEIMSSELSDIEYLFKGKIYKSAAADGFVMQMRLVDVEHGQLVKQAQISWEGSYEVAIGFATETNSTDEPRYSYIRSLATVFQPLDDLIHEYERLPDLCEVEPEKKAIEASQTMTIDVSDIVDSRMTDPQPWERICVQTEKGEILNGYEKGDWRIFEVQEGFVTLQYRAPQVCEDEQEEIQVWNSCNCKGDLFNTIPEKEIGRTNFKIYDRKPEKFTIHPEPIKVKVGDSTSIRLSNIVDAEGKPLEPNEQVMMSVDKGRITNGMPLGDYKIFDVVKGRVNVSYQAPEDLSVNLDTIKIFNLCVKGDERVEVVPNKLIAQKPIISEFPPLVARITRTLEQSRRTHIDKTKGYSRKVKRGNSLSTKRVSIIASFSDDPGTSFFSHEFQMKHAKVHYRMVDCRVVSQTFSYNGEYYSADYDYQGLYQEFTTKTVRNGRAGRINPPCEENSISLEADASRGAVKAKRMNVPFFNVEV